MATDEELRGAALQFVRKISGFHKPSKTNEAAFERAVVEISKSSERLLNELGANNRTRAALASGVAMSRDTAE
jgi:hypothetical protein